MPDTLLERADALLGSDSPSPVTMSEKLQRMEKLNDLKTSFEIRLKEIKAVLDDLSVDLVDDFTDAGIQNVSTAGGNTAYLKREIWAKKLTDDNALHDGLRNRESPWASLIHEKINSQTLSAAVRDCERDDDDNPIIPDHAAGLIGFSDKYRVKIRKS